jgi:acetylornithine deacetylase
MDRLARCRQILTALVGMDTTSHLSNLALIEWIENYLAPYPVKTNRLNHANEAKCALLVHIGPEGRGGIAFSGHSDVVPVAQQQWSTNPFELTELNERLYGRGTTDMKGFIAACLAMIPEWTQTPLTQPIYLLISYNEEIGCLAAKQIAEGLRSQNWQPDLIVIGEPTGMAAVNAHKGIASFRTVLTGKEAHSSQTQLGMNTIHYAAKLISFLADKAEAVKEPVDPRFMPPYTTIQVGMIEGGAARNIVPAKCWFAWEIRPLPGFDHQELITEYMDYCLYLERKMQEQLPEASIITTQQSNVLSLKPEEDEDLLARMLRLAESNRMEAVSFGTEAGIIQHHGYHCFVCGPGYIEQAHIPDEYVEISQLNRCLRFLKACGDELSALRL